MTSLTSDHHKLKVKIKVTDQEFPAQKETAKYLFRVAEGEMKDLRTDSTLFDYPIFHKFNTKCMEILKRKIVFFSFPTQYIHILTKI